MRSCSARALTVRTHRGQPSPRAVQTGTAAQLLAAAFSVRCDSVTEGAPATVVSFKHPAEIREQLQCAKRTNEGGEKVPCRGKESRLALLYPASHRRTEDSRLSLTESRKGTEFAFFRKRVSLFKFPAVFPASHFRHARVLHSE